MQISNSNLYFSCIQSILDEAKRCLGLTDNNMEYQCKSFDKTASNVFFFVLESYLFYTQKKYTGKFQERIECICPVLTFGHISEHYESMKYALISCLDTEALGGPCSQLLMKTLRLLCETENKNIGYLTSSMRFWNELLSVFSQIKSQENMSFFNEIQNELSSCRARIFSSQPPNLEVKHIGSRSFFLDIIHDSCSGKNLSCSKWHAKPCCGLSLLQKYSKGLGNIYIFQVWHAILKWIDSVNQSKHLNGILIEGARVIIADLNSKRVLPISQYTLTLLRKKANTSIGRDIFAEVLVSLNDYIYKHLFLKLIHDDWKGNIVSTFFDKFI